MNRFNPNEASIVNKDNIYELIGFVLQEDFIWDFTPFISLRRTKPKISYLEGLFLCFCVS